MRWVRAALTAAPGLLAAWLAPLAPIVPAAHAASVVENFCGTTPALGAGDQDRLLRFAAFVRAELEHHAAPVALVSRSGLDLSRFGLRYSHAGLSLAAGGGSPWAVRQLYYACDEGRPRLFDQGLAGFVTGTHDPRRGFVSIVLLPADAAQALADTARDRPRALRLLADTYSANAHPWRLRHQNCNQWVIELIATAAGGLADGPDLRARAQAWLRDAAYAPAVLDVGSHWLKFAAGFVPWIRLDDRGEDDERYGLLQTVSVPRSLEAFVRQRWPQARRLEFCHDGERAVLRRGWAPLGDDCSAAPGDEVRAL